VQPRNLPDTSSNHRIWILTRGVVEIQNPLILKIQNRAESDFRPDSISGELSAS